jgi:UDP-GlcNAc3NAcA epimerase
MTIVGARPQFIKAAAVSRAIAARPGVSEFMIHTGQHYDANMSDLFFEELGIPAPALHLGIGSGQHGEQTGRMMAGIEKAILEDRADWLLVYGDTNSTLAGALAATKLHVRVAHVEAGLRSFNRRMPEEVNRVLTDHVSDVLFAPTRDAVENLAREGIARDHIVLVGDVMYDVALDVRERARSHQAIVERHGVAGRDYVVATIHRADNTDDAGRLEAIMGGLAAVSRDTPVVLPLHPRTRARLTPAGIETLRDVIVTDPIGYLDLTALVIGAKLVATDSGGLQKEAFFHGIPCVTVREETEWVELIDLGWNRLLSPVSAAAVATGLRAALAAPLPDKPAVSPYGDGNAAQKIVAWLLEHA